MNRLLTVSILFTFVVGFSAGSLASNPKSCVSIADLGKIPPPFNNGLGLKFQKCQGSAGKNTKFFCAAAQYPEGFSGPELLTFVKMDHEEVLDGGWGNPEKRLWLKLLSEPAGDHYFAVIGISTADPEQDNMPNSTAKFLTTQSRRVQRGLLSMKCE